MFDSGSYVYRYYKTPGAYLSAFGMHLLVSIFIISILVPMALPSFMRLKDKCRLAHVVGGSPYLEMRMDMMYTRALTGRWPASNAETSQLGWNAGSMNVNREFITAAEIEDSTIQFVLAGKFEGKRITVRPAVPAEDEFGPIVWFCGEPLKPDGWRLFGTDRTNISLVAVHREMR